MPVSDRDNSFADKIFSGDGFGQMEGITEGPLADFSSSFDPIADAERMRKRAQRELDKTARVLGENNSFESSSGPGADRVVEGTPEPNAYNVPIEQSPEHAKSKVEGGAKKDSSPTSGAKGTSLLDKIKKNVEKKQTSAPAKGRDGDVRPAQPKDMNSGRVGNLADDKDLSAWSGSGPNSALHEEYSKVGELLPFMHEPREEEVEELLALAGVPAKFSDGPLAKVAYDMLSKQAADEYLMRDDIHPLKLMAMLDDLTGEEWRDWEPETIRDELEKEASGDVSDVVMNKVMAIKIAINRPQAFYDDWVAMEKMSAAFNDVSPTMGVIEDMPVEWLSNSVAVMSKIAGGDFSNEVESYVAARLFDSGYVIAPPLLRFADRPLGEKVANDEIRKKVIIAYAQNMGGGGDLKEDDPIDVQVARILRNHQYVMEKVDESRGQI
jgi:hypothetical protein